MRKILLEKLTALTLCMALIMAAALAFPMKGYARELNPEEREEGESGGWDHIEVAIGDQHVTHYVGGKVHCESDCVTGTLGSKDTPKGTFKITEKLPGTYLQPKGGSKVWVDRWMRITSDGVGLHDAPWRSSFGGGIYGASGSHGCINLPRDFAFQLYNEVPVGYPVLVRQ